MVRRDLPTGTVTFLFTDVEGSTRLLQAVIPRPYTALGSMPTRARLTVLYDGDCGFCQHTAAVLRRLDQRGALHLIPLRQAGAIPGAPDCQRLLEVMHVVDGDGRWSTGGGAWVRIAESLPALRPLAAVARLPGARFVIELGYRLVAANRHRLSRLLGEGSCRLDPGADLD